jgi:hypothetical protein
MEATHMAKATDGQLLILQRLMTNWQNAAKADYIEKYGAEHAHLADRDQTRFTVGKNLFHLVIGSSSAFLVDITTGDIYGNKGWLKADRKKLVGNVYDPNFNAVALVRDRFRSGRFENNVDGSLRQPIVRR